MCGTHPSHCERPVSYKITSCCLAVKVRGLALVKGLEEIVTRPAERICGRRPRPPVLDNSYVGPPLWIVPNTRIKLSHLSPLLIKLSLSLSLSLSFLYQGVWGSDWDPEPSKEWAGDWGRPATVWSLLCVAETRATRPNGEWGYSTRRPCWATSAQRRCHLEQALYLQTFRHLFHCQ